MLSDSQISTAIVTGCAGFIGRHFTSFLLDKGWYVYGIDKLTHVAVIPNKHDRFTFIQSDITEIDRIPECDVIFNFAAESDIDNSNVDCKTFIKSNIDGVRNLLSIINNSILIKTDKPLFIQISTDEVYGDVKYGLYSEDQAINPSNPYAVTKASADLLIQSWARSYDLQYNIIRPSNNYGIGQYHEKLIPLSIKRLDRGKKIKLHNNGTPIRTWTYVYDTCEAIYTIYKLGNKNSIYNVSSGLEKTNRNVISKLLQLYFKRSDINIDDYIDDTHNRIGQDIRYGISCEPLRKLGWSPKADFDLELQYIVEEHKGKHRW